MQSIGLTVSSIHEFDDLTTYPGFILRGPYYLISILGRKQIPRAREQPTTFGDWDDLDICLCTYSLSCPFPGVMTDEEEIIYFDDILKFEINKSFRKFTNNPWTFPEQLEKGRVILRERYFRGKEIMRQEALAMALLNSDIPSEDPVTIDDSQCDLIDVSVVSSLFCLPSPLCLTSSITFANLDSFSEINVSSTIRGIRAVAICITYICSYLAYYYSTILFQSVVSFRSKKYFSLLLQRSGLELNPGPADTCESTVIVLHDGRLKKVFRCVYRAYDGEFSSVHVYPNDALDSCRLTSDHYLSPEKIKCSIEFIYSISTYKRPAISVSCVGSFEKVVPLDINENNSVNFKTTFDSRGLLLKSNQPFQAVVVFSIRTKQPMFPPLPVRNGKKNVRGPRVGRIVKVNNVVAFRHAPDPEKKGVQYKVTHVSSPPKPKGLRSSDFPILARGRGSNNKRSFSQRTSNNKPRPFKAPVSRITRSELNVLHPKSSRINVVFEDSLLPILPPIKKSLSSPSVLIVPSAVPQSSPNVKKKRKRRRKRKGLVPSSDVDLTSDLGHVSAPVLLKNLSRFSKKYRRSLPSRKPLPSSLSRVVIGKELPSIPLASSSRSTSLYDDEYFSWAEEADPI